MKKKIKAGVFDRGKYAYGGQVKAFAEGLREGGLKI
ncbi:MAG: 50S ribosomal protein L18 [Patescibacteria group bacterium]